MNRIIVLFVLLITLCYVQARTLQTGLEVDFFGTGSQNSTLSVEDRRKAEELLKARTNTDRWVIVSSGWEPKKINSGLCAFDPIALECNFEEYAEGIWLQSLPALIAAVLGLLCCPIFWLMRWYNKGCGGRHKTIGWYKPEERRTLAIHAYSRREVWMVRLGMGTVALVTFIAFIAVQAGNTSLDTAADEFVAAILAGADDIIAEVEYVKGELEELDADRQGAFAGFANDASTSGLISPQLLSAIDKGVADGVAIRDQFADISEQAILWNKDRAIVLFFANITGFILSFIAALGACFGWPKGACALGFVGFLVFSLAWLSFAVHYTVSLLLSDVCIELSRNIVDDMLVQTSRSALLKTFVDCDELIGFGEYRAHIDAGIEKLYTDTCTFFDSSICGLTAPCPTEPTEVCAMADCPTNITCSKDTLVDYLDSVRLNDFRLGCVAATCYNVSALPTDISSALDALENFNVPGFDSSADLGTLLAMFGGSFGGKRSDVGALSEWRRSVMRAVARGTPPYEMHHDNWLEKRQDPCPTPGASDCPKAPATCTLPLVGGVCATNLTTLADCAETCWSDELKLGALAVRSATALVNKYGSLWDGHVKPLLECSVVYAAIAKTNDAMCVRGVTAVQAVAIGSAIMGAAMFFGIIFGVLGSKRFTTSFRKMYRDRVHDLQIRQARHSAHGLAGMRRLSEQLLRGKQQFICTFPQCGKSYDSAENLRAHKEARGHKTEEDGVYLCRFPGCAQQFATRDLLKEHKKKKKHQTAKSHTVHDPQFYGTLWVQLVKGVNLPIGDSNGLSDPYVVFRKGGNKVQKSKVVKETLNPKWNQQFSFAGATGELEMEIMDWDMLSADDSLGFVWIDLDHACPMEGVPYEAWHKILSEDGTDVPGHIHLVLYWTSAEVLIDKIPVKLSGPPPPQRDEEKAKLVVTVVKARDLKAADVTGSSDPYVDLLKRGNKRQRTGVIRQNLNPEWNERFVFKGATGKVRFTVKDRDMTSRDDLLGLVEIDIEVDCPEADTEYESWHKLHGPKGGDTSGELRLKVFWTQGNHLRAPRQTGLKKASSGRKNRGKDKAKELRESGTATPPNMRHSGAYTQQIAEAPDFPCPHCDKHYDDEDRLRVHVQIRHANAGRRAAQSFMADPGDSAARQDRMAKGPPPLRAPPGPASAETHTWQCAQCHNIYASEDDINIHFQRRGHSGVVGRSAEVVEEDPDAWRRHGTGFAQFL